MAQPIVARWFDQWEADPRLLVSRGTSQEMGDHGPSHQIDLEKNGELEAILIDGQKRITTDSIYRRLILKTIESYPAGAPPKKARLPPSAHRPKPSFQPKARRAAPAHVLEREPIQAMELEAARIEAPSAPKRARGRPRKYARKYQAELTAQ